MKRRAFVTGATGFLGRNLIEQLVREDWDIRALCLPTDKTEWLNRLGATIAIGNITDRESLVQAMTDSPDVVFHVAANTSSWSAHDAEQYQDNVVGTGHMLDVALQKGAKRFVYTSSISSYGYQPGCRLNESTPSNALTCGHYNYGKTKYQAEQLVKKAVQRGLSTVILNPVNILGPYDVNNWTKQLIRPVFEGKMRIVPPGRAMWCYVKDAVNAHIAAVDRGTVGENYLLGGDEASFKEVINEIERQMGKPLSTRVTPTAVLWLAMTASELKSKVDDKEPSLTVERYKRAVAHISCNFDKATRDLGFKVTPLRVTLQATIRWLTDEHLLVGKGSASEGLRRVSVGVPVNEPVLGPHSLTDAKLGVEFVEVNDEPNHVERFSNDWVRVYMATIAPGTKTLYHRHRENTLYIAIEGGIHHNDLPGTQKQRSIGLPRSLRLTTKVGWLLRRLLFGTVDLPTSTMVMQYHRDFPIIHRICASPKNGDPMELLGIEVFRHPARRKDTPLDASGFALEYTDAELTVYRIRLDAGSSTRHRLISGPSLLVVTTGSGRLSTGNDSASSFALNAGGARWLGEDSSIDLINIGNDVLDVLLVTILGHAVAEVLPFREMLPLRAPILTPASESEDVSAAVSTPFRRDGFHPSDQRGD
jgi:nucleoside-diphosphate-sugar epimerase